MVEPQLFNKSNSVKQFSAKNVERNPPKLLIRKKKTAYQPSSRNQLLSSEADIAIRNNLRGKRIEIHKLQTSWFKTLSDAGQFTEIFVFCKELFAIYNLLGSIRPNLYSLLRESYCVIKWHKQTMAAFLTPYMILA